MSFLDRIREINRHDPAAFAPFAVDGRRLGAVRNDRIDSLLSATAAIVRSGDGSLTFADGLAAGGPGSVAARNEAMAGAVARLSEAGAIARLRGELYPAARRFGETAAFVVDRAAVPFFGLRAWGVHLNGYTRRGGALHTGVEGTQRHSDPAAGRAPRRRAARRNRPRRPGRPDKRRAGRPVGRRKRSTARPGGAARGLSGPGQSGPR